MTFEVLHSKNHSFNLKPIYSNWKKGKPLIKQARQLVDSYLSFHPIPQVGLQKRCILFGIAYSDRQ